MASVNICWGCGAPCDHLYYVDNIGDEEVGLCYGCLHQKGAK